jgi:hypothetical protein
MIVCNESTVRSAAQTAFRGFKQPPGYSTLPENKGMKRENRKNRRSKESDAACMFGCGKGEKSMKENVRT